MTITKEKAKELWSTGETITDDIAYKMHRMSYGDYFLEPTTWKGGENDGFSSKTRWGTVETIKNIQHITF